MEHAWILAGATATGKSAVAQLLAERLGCAILSADAMLVYRGMDIGTAKPTPAERGSVPYFGIDLVTPAEPFSTGAWLSAAAHALAALPNASVRSGAVRRCSPRLIVAGGTGLYIKALTAGLDGEQADPGRRARWQALYERDGLVALRLALEARSPGALERLDDPANPRRLIRALEHLDARGGLPENWRAAATPPTVIALRLPREQLHRRIARRVANMFRQGLTEEVRALRRTCPDWSPTALQAIGYAEVLALLDGTLSQEAAFERIVVRTRQLAKRQETWFRHQTRTVWLDIAEDETPADIAPRVLALWRQHGPTPILSP